MKSSFSGVALFVCLCLFSIPAHAETQPGDACTTANDFVRSGGPETSGTVYFMICNGSTWGRVIEVDNSANVGVKQAAPAATLHVGGEAIVGYTGLGCSGTTEGAIRYDSAGTALSYCDGTAWRTISSSAGSPSPGSDRQVVFNSGGLLHAESGFEYVSSGKLDIGTFGTNNLFIQGGNLTTAGKSNVAIGPNALDSLAAVCAGDECNANTAIGKDAMTANTTGQHNTAIGFITLVNNTTGKNNTVMGYAALADNTTGEANTASGFNALWNNTTGNNNTAVGYAALRDNTEADGNTAVGREALSYFATTNTGSTYNTAMGYRALYGVSGSTDGERNTALGALAGDSITTGSNNVAVGDSAGDSLTTGSNNILIGSGVDVPAADTSNYINIGGVYFGNSDTGLARVAGALQVDYDASACSSTIQGAIRYDSAGTALNYCDGTAWQTISGSGGSPSPGSDRQVVFNAGGVLAADSNFVFTSSGLLGIGAAAPVTRLDIAGTLKVADGGEACAAGLAGAVKYSATLMYLCNGTAWVPVNTGAGGLWTQGSGDDIYYSSGAAPRVGIGTNSPKAPLQVAGEAIIGASTGLPCDADREGGLRWNATDKTVEMCDGSSWRKIAATLGATDCTPDVLSFTDLTDQPFSSLILSNIVNITGIDPGCTVSVSGGGTPKISVNGGAWVTATAIDPGDTLRAQLISSGLADTELIAAVTVGATTDNWSVTTKAGGTRIFETSNTYTGNLGGIGAAHTICQNEAGTLGYSGLFRALLSNDIIAAKDMLTITYPVVRAADGVTVDSTNLWDGAIQNPVVAGGSGSYTTWTGTDSDGTTDDSGENCNNWHSASGSETGQTARHGETNAAWVAYASGTACNVSRYIYCVEQGSALGAILWFSPSAKSGMHVFGTGSPAYGDAVTFTMENAGDTVSDTIATSLSNTTNFEFVTDNCDGQTLAPGATCTVSIRPKAALPGGEGPISGTFNVTANNNPSASLSGTAATEGLRIFRTGSTYTGNLGGIGAAHALCQSEAGTLGYSGLWRALLSDDSVNAKDMLTITYPVVRAADGVTVDSTNLWDGSIQNSVVAGVSSSEAWTGVPYIGRGLDVAIPNLM